MNDLNSSTSHQYRKIYRLLEIPSLFIKNYDASSPFRKEKSQLWLHIPAEEMLTNPGKRENKQHKNINLVGQKQL